MSKLVHKVEAAASKIIHPKTSKQDKTSIVTTGLDNNSIEPVKDGQRTPADEAIFFFESSTSADAQPVQVWELQLEEDGAPSKDKAVREYLFIFPNIFSLPSLSRQYIRLPPPRVPYVLRVSIDAGSPATKNGVFKTNFPLDGGVFDRDKIQERTSVSQLSICSAIAR